MSNIVPTARYYPRLSEVITVEDLPEFLSFVQNGLNAIFDKIHYKNLQYSKSYRGDSAFYSLEIVCSTKLAIPLPFDLALVINPDLTGGDSNISSFPITLEYQWEILAFLKSFDLANFSFTLEDFYKVGLQIFRISENQVLAHILNNFVVPSDEITTKFEQLFDDLNDVLDLSTPLELPADPNLQSAISAIKQHTEINDSISGIMFAAYLLNSDIDEMKAKLQEFFNLVVPEGIESYIKKLIIPKAKATLALSAGIEFPKNILKPVNPDGSDITNPATKTTFVFAQAELYADTESGIGYELELGGSLLPEFAEIGNTGLLLQIDSLKLDLSKKTNIPEADADGRPDNFTGVYARSLSVTLPARWFHEDAVQGTPLTTLKLGGYDLLIGTGGVSGTFMLETVPSTITGGTTYYFDDKFDINFPITLFEKNTETKVIEEIVVTSLEDLKTKLFPLSTTGISPSSIKFPITLNEKLPLTGGTKTFVTNTAYQSYLNSLTVSGAVDLVPTLWKKIGSAEKGFRVGFNFFDITLKQNKVISSNIKGALEIKKFVYPQGSPNAGRIVHIDIEGHLHDNGDFNLTASAQPAYPIELPEIFTYSLKTVELGKEGEDFYIGTSGTIQFQGILQDVLKIGPIEVDRLRIYSDGSIEFVGGSINLIEPIVLPIGPADITVTAIHYGSHQKEVNGVMRKFNFFGFDGGISIDPLGVEIRGDGIKYYYCVDDILDANGAALTKPKPYLHIQTLYLDLTIPSTTPVAIINGWLSIPEPGVSKEYAGGIKLQLPKAKISGSASMKLMPKYPAFIIDAEIDLPMPIPLGTFAIYGFRGLVGYRYVAEKEAAGLISGVNTWYDYYKAPPRGIHVQKFNGPDKTTKSGTPVSIGAGASLGTSFDNGMVLNIKAMVLLSIPSLFMIDGRAAIISARLGLEETKDPPFFAFVAMGDNSLEFGFGADFKMPTKTGEILALYAEAQAGFFFNSGSKWYVNVGTKNNPTVARILTLITLKSYVMLSAKGIEAGARGDFDFKRNYGIIKVHAWAYVEIGGKVSFGRPQFGAYLAAGVGADINIKIVRLHLEVGILFGVEAPKPFLIFGKFYYSVRIRIAWIFKFKFSGNLEVFWEFNRNVDQKAINPFITIENPADAARVLANTVKGVNMLSNETFQLAYLGGAIPQGLDARIKDHVIPLDTYIDIKTEKGLLPGNVANRIGGFNNPAQRYADLVPPEAVVRGKAMRQVTHEYSIEKLEIKIWNGDGYWQDYSPYEALYPDHPDTALLRAMKIGQFQKTDGQYNAVRLLATTPFSFTEQGQPGWHVPEQYGVTGTTLFCSATQRQMKYADFLNRQVGQRFFSTNPDDRFFSNGVAFLLAGHEDGDYASVTGTPNIFQTARSLAFSSTDRIEILLPQSSSRVELKLTGEWPVKLSFYAAVVNDGSRHVTYGHPNPQEAQQQMPYVVVLSRVQMRTAYTYQQDETWKGVLKIVVEPLAGQGYSWRQEMPPENIEERVRQNIENLTSNATGQGIQSEVAATEITNQAAAAQHGGFVKKYSFEKIRLQYAAEFIEDGVPFIYAIGHYEKYFILSKTDCHGVTVWNYRSQGASGTPLVSTTEIIQLKRTSASVSYSYVFKIHDVNEMLLGCINASGEILWLKSVDMGTDIVSSNIVASQADSTFFAVCGLHNNEKVILSKFNAGGTLIASRAIEDMPELEIKSVSSEIDGIVLSGSFVDTQWQTGMYLKISYDFSANSGFFDLSGSTCFSGMKVLQDGSFLFCGHYEGAEPFISINTVKGEYALKYFNYGQRIAIELCSGGFYALIFDGMGSVLHKMTLDLEIVWSKKIAFSQLGDHNTIKSFHYNETSGSLTFADSYDNSGELASMVINSKGNLDVCMTQILENPPMADSTINLAAIASMLSAYNEVSTIDQYHDMDHLPFQEEIICGSNCDDEGHVCGLMSRIAREVEQRLADPAVYFADSSGLEDMVDPVGEISNLLYFFTGENFIQHLYQLIYQLTAIDQFLFSQTPATYQGAYAAFLEITDYLNDLGHCDCGYEHYEPMYGHTMLHRIGWLSVEDYRYNINIPGQHAINEDTRLAIAGINKFIQPVWRPDSNFVVYFELKDRVGNNGPTSEIFKYAYGFSTAGPLGYFHSSEKATYGDIPLKQGEVVATEEGTAYQAAAGDILEDANGLVRKSDGSLLQPQRFTAHPDKYALTSLKQYIDYERSYPNADGNLLSAKPLFYAERTTEISLFFNRAYATHFFHDWHSYRNKPEIKGRMKIIIKDPREDISITNPPRLDIDTTVTTIPQTIERWETDENPQIPFVISQYANLLGDGRCTGIIETIKPASQFVRAEPKYLKPQKLYTAIVNNMYHIGEGEIQNAVSDTREVHRFVFQTSRYRNFNEQVMSYLLQDEETGDSKPAIFIMEKEISAETVAAAYSTVMGQPVMGLSAEVLSNLQDNYQHPFDRVFEGIFGISPLEQPVSTEFNMIRNATDGKIIALLIRNPEPFNNPKMPLDAAGDTIQVLAAKGRPNTDYNMLLSKDYSQAIIMHSSGQLASSIRLRFYYKVWNGTSYQVPGVDPETGIDMGTVITDIMQIT